MLPAIDLGHASHVGLRREHNEDTYYADTVRGLFLVADGLGGHAAGEVASAVARDTVVCHVMQGQGLVQAVRDANDAIYDIGGGGREGTMATTLVAMRMRGQIFDVVWVGDSRAYSWDDREGLKQITRDHSYVQDMVDKGLITAEQARVHPNRHAITQALGTTDGHDLLVDARAVVVRPGQALLLCSDGLSEMVSEAEIERCLRRRDISAQECAEHLILAALDGGGHDNVTVITLFL